MKRNSNLSEYLEDIIKNAESNADNVKVGTVVCMYKA